MIDLLVSTGLSDAIVSLPAAGLDGLWDSFREDWLAPLLIGIVAVAAVMAIWGRKLRDLLVLAAVAVIAGLFVFRGEDLFGGADASLTGAGGDLVDQVR